MHALIVLPNQLFIEKDKNVDYIIIEDNHYFNDEIKYHKHKLILHRASLKHYYDTLNQNKTYLEYPVKEATLHATLNKYDKVYMFDPINHVVLDRYKAFNITLIESPNFLTTRAMIEDYFSKNKFYMYDFYTFQRRRLNILMEESKPVGGKYSFDSDNRKKLPKDIKVQAPLTFNNAYSKKAQEWVDQTFPNNPGLSSTFNHPTSKMEALKQMTFFFTHKFNHFGPYQDALSEIDPYLFHSNLSSSLNIGLLNPLDIVNAALKTHAPIESKEGFIRQIIGWREYIRAVYHLKGNTMRKMNVLNHHYKLSDAWLQATTNIPILDYVIEKLIHTSYSHHIERLMVLGNTMMMCHVDPNEVYKYFMAMHIDAYDWVMVPNVYGMSQYASGDLMITKPYFSSANYLLKMGVKKGEWETIYEALFYLFIESHKTMIKSNPRLKMLMTHYNKKSQDELNAYKIIKENLLKRLVIKK
ncbi:MAG: cryptochrome/photolyase family protein [Candidatus Izemoplasmataceae bacterium]